MNRPWKVWLWFFLALALVVPAMGWLTHKALELDHEVAQSARAADLEEDISLALWRMDVALAPLVAQEAARPFVVYRPFLIEPDPEGTKGGLAPQVSPLLVQPSEFVRLHFQLNDDGSLSSPQCPTGELRELVVDNNDAPRGNIIASCESLSQLSESIKYNELAQRLPDQTLPPFEVTDLAWDNRLNIWYLNDFNQQVLVQNDGPLQQLNLPNAPPIDNALNAPEAQGPAPSQQGFSDALNQEDQLAQAGGNGPFHPQMLGSPGGQQGRGEKPNPWSEQYGGNFGYGRAPRAQLERGQVEFQRRNKALQSYANTEVVRQRKQLPAVSLPKQKVQEGVSAPLWVDSELLLARRVKVDDREVVQGCWFHWEKLKPFLIAEGIGTDGAMTASLPDFDLRPITDERAVAPARRLATLPLEIVVPTPKFVASSLSPIRLSLWIVWGCLIFATGGVALILQGVITLSERRGAFVSAVTHELRTPLTTFRMYAEMLSTGMVQEREQQQQYTETLRVEADRLSHLVENVLAYARLERGRKGGRRENVSVDQLLQRTTSRLKDRAAQAQMKLNVDVGDEFRAAVLHTDPQAVEQILFNLVDNACKYAGAAEDRSITITASRASNTVAFYVCDRGPGISADFTKKLFQPFSKSVEDAAASAPGVGLGLALCRRLACELGGSLELEPSDHGATFRLTLPTA